MFHRHRLPSAFSDYSDFVRTHRNVVSLDASSNNQTTSKTSTLLQQERQNTGDSLDYYSGLVASPHLSTTKRLRLFTTQKQYNKAQSFHVNKVLREEEEREGGSKGPKTSQKDEKTNQTKNGILNGSRNGSFKESVSFSSSSSSSSSSSPSSSSTSTPSSSTSSGVSSFAPSSALRTTVDVAPISTSSSLDPLMSAASAISRSSVISPAMTKRLFIDSPNTSQSMLYDPQNASSQSSMLYNPQSTHDNSLLSTTSHDLSTDERSTSILSVEQSILQHNQNIKSEVALSPDLFNRYSSPRYVPSPLASNSASASSSVDQLKMSFENSLLSVTKDWASNTEARTKLLEKQHIRELNSEKEFQVMEAISAEARRVAEERAIAIAKKQQALAEQQKREQEEANRIAQAKAQAQAAQAQAEQEAMLKAQAELEEALKKKTEGEIPPVPSSPLSPQSPPPPPSVLTSTLTSSAATSGISCDEYLVQWRLLKKEAEDSQSSWIKSVNKRAKYINLVSSSNILQSAQSLMAALPTSLNLNFFDFWVVSTVTKKVLSLTNHEADDFLKFGGLLCACIQVRPTLGPLTLGCIAHLFSSSENADGGSLLAPNPTFPMNKLPPQHDQGYIELCSLQMCIMKPMRYAILSALHNNQAGQGTWLTQQTSTGGSGEGVDTLVWLSKLADVSIQHIQDNSLSNNQIMMLGDFVLEPCLRVCGSLLWKCYGNEFEDILVKIRKQILRPLEIILTAQKAKDMKPQIQSRLDAFLRLIGETNCSPLGAPHGIGKVPLLLDFSEEVSGTQKEERSKKRIWLHDWANQSLHLNIRNFPGDIGPEPTN
mmetsp:Transcript_29038/g.34248  ORF Transcript_29038/g.34248 Transcript_29038/m.34248 type:complete len:826 (-) Transcript_29038:143-2620(-)